MCYNYTGSKFRLSILYFSVGIIFSKHSIAHQGHTQDFSKGVSKESIAKAISTVHFVPACAWCTRPVLGKICDAQGGFQKLRKPPCVRPCTPTAGPRGFSRQLLLYSACTHLQNTSVWALCKHKSYMYMRDIMGH